MRSMIYEKKIKWLCIIKLEVLEGVIIVIGLIVEITIILDLI